MLKAAGVRSPVAFWLPLTALRPPLVAGPFMPLVASSPISTRFAPCERSASALRGLLVATCFGCVLLASTSAARASCGDYVVIGKPGAKAVADSEPHTGDTDRSVTENQRPAMPSPCHAPGCRRAPRPFAAPPAPVQQMERWHDCLAWSLNDVNFCADAFRAQYMEAENQRFQVGWYPALWRPPRS